jgi:hypothetical protein
MPLRGVKGHTTASTSYHSVMSLEVVIRPWRKVSCLVLTDDVDLTLCEIRHHIVYIDVSA